MISFALSYQDLPITGLLGNPDGDIDMLIQATGTKDIDILKLDVDFEDLSLTKSSDKWLATHDSINNVVLSLKDIERIENSGQGLAFDIDGNAGDIYALLAVALSKDDVTQELLGIGMHLKDSGATVSELAELIVRSDLFKQDALGNSNETFVKQMYKNIFNTAPSFADLIHFTNALDSGAVTQAQLLEYASNLELTRDADHINLVGMNMIEYTPYVG